MLPEPNTGERRSGLGVLLLAVGAVLSVGCGRNNPPPAPPSPLTIATQFLADGTVGIAYSATVTANSGVLPHTWSVSAGALPDGVSLDGSTGTLSGTPTVANTFTFTLQVSDAGSETATQAYTVRIGAAGNPQVVRVSLASDGTEGTGRAGSAALSPDGRFVAFTSFADNLVANDTNSVPDVFLRDLDPTCNVNVTERVSLASDGTTEGNLASFAPALSALDPATNILFITYSSDATNLVANDTNTNRDIFVTAVQVADPPTCALTAIHTARVSVASDGTEGDNQSSLPTISADGAFVAYHSFASNLVDTDTNVVSDIFITELSFSGGIITPGQTRRYNTFKVAVAVGIPDTTADIFSATTIGNSTLTMTVNEHVGRQVEIIAGTGQGETRLITGNDATTLTVNPAWTTTPDATSVFRITTLSDQTADSFSPTTIGNSALTMTTDEHINRLVEIMAGAGAGQTRAITANDAATLTVDPPWTTDPDATSVFRIYSQGTGVAARARISSDASFVGFNSSSAFQGESTTTPNAVFVQERATGLTTRVSIASDGTVGDLASSISVLEGNSRFVLFQSQATNLVANDTNDSADLFLHDRSTGTTLRVSLAADGSEADADSTVVAGLSGGGRFVAFESSATNLVLNDRNQAADIFLRDRLNNATSRISLGLDGINPNGGSLDVAISQDGSAIAFTSSANNLVLNDTNSTSDVFLATTGALDPPMIVVSRLPLARAGAVYDASLLTVGGTPPLTFSISGGSLPPGVFLDGRSGRLLGAPRRTGHFRFTVAVMDADRPARLTRRTFTLLVAGVPERN